MFDPVLGPGISKLRVQKLSFRETDIAMFLRCVAQEDIRRADQY